MYVWVSALDRALKHRRALEQPRLAGDRQRAATTAERPAATVKEDRTHASGLQQRGERALRLVHSPRRREVPDVLVGVRVADHHLLPVSPGPQRGPVRRLFEQRAERRAATRRTRTAARLARSATRP